MRREADPYYPFEEAVDVWARTFAALGINYKVRTWGPPGGRHATAAPPCAAAQAHSLRGRVAARCHI